MAMIRRDVKEWGLEERAAEGSLGVLSGYAAVYEQWADIGTFFREKINRGAFSGSMGADIRALHGHDTSLLLGRSKSGTLAISDDEKGVHFRLDLPDTQTGRDVLTLVKRGDLTGMSIGFSVPRGGDVWTSQEGKPTEREITKADLVEISTVAFPAYEGTSVVAREQAERELREWQDSQPKKDPPIDAAGIALVSYRARLAAVLATVDPIR